LLIAFLPLAFSDDLLVFLTEQNPALAPSSWWLLLVDFILYVVIFALMWGFGLPPLGSRSRGAVVITNGSASGKFFFLSLVLTIIFDAMSALGWFSYFYPLGLLASLALYMLPQTFIYMAIVLAPKSPGSHTDWLVGGPLLLGTLLTWIIGSFVWTGLDSAAAPFDPRVDQEYFAQMSQLLPVLLIALAVELNFFRSGGDSQTGAQQARAAVVGGIVAIGVFGAMLNLLRDPDAPLSELGLWGEYVAYVITMDAVSVALASFVWALVLKTDDSRMLSRGALPTDIDSPVKIIEVSEPGDHE
jgi:hypothetical protein